LYVKDWLGDNNILALTLEEQGAYLRLLCCAWQGDGLLPADLKEIQRLLSVSSHKFEKIWKKISKFFEPVQEKNSKIFLKNKRLFFELEKSYEISGTRSKAGSKGGKATQAKAKANNQAKFEQLLKQTTKQSQSQSQSHTQSHKNIGSKDEGHIRVRAGARMSPDKSDDVTPVAKTQIPHKQIADTFNEILTELPQVQTLTEKRRASIKARWNEAEERQDLDWWRQYFLKVKESDFLTGRVHSRDREPFLASFDWLIRPVNMPKVLEGNYDNRAAAPPQGRNEAAESFRVIARKYGYVEPNQSGGDVIDVGDTEGWI